MRLVHVVANVAIEASGPSHSVPARCTGLSRLGDPRRLLASILVLLHAGDREASAAPEQSGVAEEITREALKPNSDIDHPLPLAATWATGRIWADRRAPADYMPLWQLRQVALGHHLIPTFAAPDPSMLDPAGAPHGSTLWKEYYQRAFEQAAALRLPFTLAGTQWEEALYTDPTWANLPADQNPNQRVPGVKPGTTIGRVAIVATGAGYRVGDVLSVVGGKASAPAQLTLTSVDGQSGAAYAAKVTNPGAYTQLPSGPVATRGGSGTGARLLAFDAAFAPRVSAFGATLPWQQVGARWTTAVRPANPGGRSMLAYLQAWYPDPPLVLYLSNNEAKRELLVAEAPGDGASVDQDQSYLDRFGNARSADFKREKLGEGWIERYRLLQAGMRNGLTPTWQQRVRFIGYDAFGPPHLGRWADWMRQSLLVPGRIDPSPLAWDGASVSHYVGNGARGYPWDSKVWSTQVESMNQVFMLEQARRLNPEFWFELSTWNSCDFYPTTQAPPSEPSCANMGKTAPGYTPSRYAGSVQFSMWMLRPRAVRDFRGYGSRTADSGAYVDALLAAVDKVHTDPTLRSFWRNSELVPNTARPHPYEAKIPAEYRNTPRMFLLDTDLDPGRPWALDTTLPVFALARVQGAAPNRRWLVYAHSPERDRAAVRVSIPGYRTVSVAAKVGGAFSLVEESSGAVTDVEAGAKPHG